MADGSASCWFTACRSAIPASSGNSGRILNLELIFRQTCPSVVQIKNGVANSGTGFVWGHKRYIVTNYHVIRGISDIRVSLKDDSTNYNAEVVWSDWSMDIAVLRTNVPGHKLRPIPIGVSANLRVGQEAFAIGHPEIYDYTVTSGVVSAIRPNIPLPGSNRPVMVVQTTAAINPGNSGGPLLDSYGHLIGINTFIDSAVRESNGLGFAIAADTVVCVVNCLMCRENTATQISGIMTLPDRGVNGVPVLAAHLHVPSGKAFVQSTTSESYGRPVVDTDIIRSVGQRRVSNGSDLHRFLERCQPGDTVTVEVLRARGLYVEKFLVILRAKISSRHRELRLPRRLEEEHMGMDFTPWMWILLLFLLLWFVPALVLVPLRGLFKLIYSIICISLKILLLPLNLPFVGM